MKILAYLRSKRLLDERTACPPPDGRIPCQRTYPCQTPTDILGCENGVAEMRLVLETSKLISTLLTKLVREIF